MYQRLSRKYQIKTPWWIYVGAALDQLSLSKTVNDAGRGGLPLTLNTWGVVLTSRVSSGCPRILLTSGLVKASYVGLAIAFVGAGQKREDGRERQWGGSRGAIVGPFYGQGDGPHRRVSRSELRASYSAWPLFAMGVQFPGLDRVEVKRFRMRQLVTEPERPWSKRR